MEILKKIAFILLVIGGLNWGLVGLFSLDLVAFLPMVLAKVVYVLVGISALVVLFTSKGSFSSDDETVNSAPMQDPMSGGESQM